MYNQFNSRENQGMTVGSELSVESFKQAQRDQTYRLAAPRYYTFYANYVRSRMGMYNGWIDGFHNTEYGVLPTLFLQKIGNGVVNTLFNKPIVLNTSDAQTSQKINSKEFKKVKLTQTIKECYNFALAGGAGLIKINKDGTNNLRFETVPMDKFFLTTDSYGDVEKVKCYLTTYHDTIYSDVEFHLCEERFFRYCSITNKRYPMAHYTIYKTSSNIQHESTPDSRSNVVWKEIPKEIQELIRNDHGEIYIDTYNSRELSERYERARSNGEKNTIYQNCKLLPFDDDLGCRILKFTNNIPAFPKLPFGQPIADLLMNESYAYDQLKFFERTEVYTARARIMIDEGQTNPNDPHSRKKALDPFLFTYYDNTLGDGKDGQPIPIQPALRAEDIRTQKQNILNDTAFSLNLSSSTIAAWLSDGTSQKTATEIEYERTKTDSFINDKIELIREPLQELIDIYFHHYGLTSPEINLMPESQASRSESIRLYSELYDKGHIPAKKLAEVILGTSSVKEVEELAEYIEEEKSNGQFNAMNNFFNKQQPQPQGQPEIPTDDGIELVEVENENI